MAKLSDREILAIIEAEERNALGWGNGELSVERESLLRQYYQEPYGNEVEGRSQVVTSEIADTIEGMLPSLLRVFSASDQAVEFEPQGVEDVQAAKQATDAANYVFYRQNNGFMVLYEAFKDALLQKNGYIRVSYEPPKRLSNEKYKGLTGEELAMLLEKQTGNDIKPVDYTQNPDGTIDVEIEVWQRSGVVDVQAIPPEEMIVSRFHGSVDLQDAPFCERRTMKTVGELKDMGYDVSQLEGGGTDDVDVNALAEWVTRVELSDGEQDQFALSVENNVKKASHRLWVSECYIRTDEGDGKLKLLKVVKSGKSVFERKEVDVIPFAAGTAIVNPHRHIGRSKAEEMADLQLIKTTITRQFLDGLYLANAPRMAVLGSPDGSAMANLDDVLNVRPGGIVREYAPNAVRPLVQPFVGQYALTALEYLEGVGEQRSGVTRYNQGLDANSLNKTATGMNIIANAAQMRLELVARIFAETMVKQCFKLILHCLATSGMSQFVYRLRNEFTAADPRAWKTSWDMTVNVGLGTGNKDQQAMHLQGLLQMQQQIIQMGGLDKVVTLKNVYNALGKYIENVGFKDVESYITDPEKVPPQPPQEPPEVQAEKAKLQLKAQESQMSMQMKAQEHQQNMAFKAQEHQMDMQMQREKAQLDAEVKIATANQDAMLNAQRTEAEVGIKRSLAERPAEQQQMSQTVTSLQQQVQSVEALMSNIGAAIDNLAKLAAAKRRVVRDPKTNRVVGAEIVTE